MYSIAIAILGRVCDHVNVFGAAIAHQQSGVVFEIAAGPLPLEHLVECCDVVRVNAACNQRERYRLPLVDLEEAVDFLRPRYFIRRDSPGEGSGGAEVLHGGEEVLAALECGIVVGAIDGDGREVRKLVNQLVIESGRGSRSIVVERERA
jgi:hypothetical protein